MIHPDPIFTNNPLLFAECILKQGIVIAFGQTFFMLALLVSKKSGPVCMIGFTSVIFSYFLSVFRYNEPLNLLCIAGSLIALIGIYYTVIK
jgi:drug/metabolite transporter (DMT)-like permease